MALAGIASLVLAACGGGGGGGSSATISTGGGTTTTASNSVAVTVDGGPTASSPIDNVAYTTVTLCQHGSSSACLTIDHVQIDTGSVGFRVLNEVLAGALTASQLTAVKDPASGNPLAECIQFVDGYSFGSLKTADLTVGGETASNIVIHVIGDLATQAIPSGCSTYNPPDPFNQGVEDTVAQFGANAILGVQPFLQDCGSGCPTDGSTYSVCASSTSCSGIAVALTTQVSNPVQFFAKDNNGVALTMANSATNGNGTGTLYFGIGTETNNALGSAQIYTLDPNTGYLLTNFTPAGGVQSTSYVDAGSNAYYFDDGSLATCTDNTNFFCPAQTTSLSAVIEGQNGTQSTIDFSIGNADSIFSQSSAFQPNLGGTSGSGSGTFAWGLPFFYGRTIFFGLEGQTFGGQSGPLIAF